MDEATIKPLNFIAPARVTPLGIRLAPLIDIVFLLNCFFMMATEMVRSHVDPRVELPQMASLAGLTEAPAEIILNLGAEDWVTANGTELQVEQLASWLAAQSGRSFTPVRVVIRADRRQRFERLDAVLAACRDAGLKTVVLRAKQENGS